jgi:hypothetical protein
MAAADGCCALAAGPIVANIIASAAGLAPFLMASMTLIRKLHLATDITIVR